MKPELSIIIVSWNVQDFLRQCLESIAKYQDDLKLEILVIDNASTDDTVEMIKKDFSNIKLIANNKNLGFAAANNQGMLSSRGEFILLLNPDTVIIKNAIVKMMEFIKKNYQIGVLGCKHLNADWTIQPSVRRYPSLWPLFLIGIKLAKIFPNLPSVNKYLAKGFNYKIAQPVDQVAGSCFMIRRKTIDEIGMFDENFFIWFEEVDFCKRAQAAGWQIWYQADAEIIHHGGQSFKQQITLQKQKLFFQSTWYYFRKHGFGKSRPLD